MTTPSALAAANGMSKLPSPARMPPPGAPFLLIFRDSDPAVYATLSPERRRELISQWNAWFDGLAAQGKVRHGHPLEPRGCVVSGAKGEIVTDGPYAEAKEAVGGFFLLEVADLDEATAIAKQCPSLPLGLSVEVRPVAAESPTLRGLRGRAGS